MDLIQKVYKALAADPAIFNWLADKKKGIWADLTDYAGEYPVIAYSVISDVPVIFSDDMENGRRVVLQLSIVTSDGADHELVQAVNRRMNALEWVRMSTARVTDGAMRITAIRYVILDTNSYEEKEGNTNG